MNALPVALTLTLSLCLGACARQESAREIDWARAALERNPDFEIVATDERAGVFTVRDTATGEMRTLKLGDLIAAPLPPREAAPPAPATPAEPEAPSPEEPAADPALAADQTTLPPVPESQGPALAEGPGYSITRGTGSKPEPAGALEGPGYSITQATPTPRTAQAQSADTAPAGVERRSDPIICQGNRLMRIDGQTIEFTGDAVIAEQGCDLYISNARIRAGGVGIIARQQARVHIVNSTINGSRGSYEASDGAEIYVARTTFTGIGRRFDGGTMTDLGGNSYQTH